MPENEKSMQINADLRPAFYDQFKCLAAGCRFSCCMDGWRVTFDKKDYLALKRQKGSPEFNALMERSLRRIRKGPLSDIHFGEFDMSGGSCPLLREDGLCVLQMEKGHQALPEVCRIFPRKKIYMPSGYLERCVGPACEGVLELLWNLPEGVEFLSDPLPKTEYEVLPFHKDSLNRFFGPVREWCIDMLQDRRFPLPRRILLMGLALKELTKENVDVVEWLLYANALPEMPEEAVPQPEGNASLAMFLINNIHILLRLPSELPAFGRIPSEICKGVGLEPTIGTTQASISLGPYLRARERFQEQFGDRDYFFENLMVTLFFHLCFPLLRSPEELWGSYVNFCNLYSFYRFMAVMSCRDGVEDCRAELFRLIVFASRQITHTKGDTSLRDELFKNGSSTLAHMAILLGG